ncbi:MAG TPA: hypothetical protein VK576_05330 [Thermoleophilia bacterium]|nr:hypothetical protein [Thermoleophilia bacterium]
MSALKLVIRLVGDPPRHLQIAARLGTGQVTLVGCAVLLSMGLRVYPDPPQTAYPLRLGPGRSHIESFDCKMLATRLRQSGEHGETQLIGLVLEAGGFEESVAPKLPSSLRTAGGVEHRSEPFVFNVARWTEVGG